MTTSRTDITLRRERLASVFAVRRARLATALVEEPRRAVGSARPLARLQRSGYSLAAALTATALFPSLVRILFKRRKWVVGAATTAWRMSRWKKRLDALPPPGARR